MGYLSYTPPAKNWATEPIERTEILWILLALTWVEFAFFFMVAWHWIGNQNMSNEAYKVVPEVYAKKVENFVASNPTRPDTTNPDLQVVIPPPGSDVYLEARQFQWRPLLELQKDKSYRIHFSSLDMVHGFSLQPENINFSAYPGYEAVVTMKPNKSGVFDLMCNEYCGLGHHTMTGRIYVKE